MAESTAKKALRTSMSNTWIIGVVLIVFILGGAALYQMKLKNDLQTSLDEKKKAEKGKEKPKDSSKDYDMSGTSMGGDDEGEDEDPSDGMSMS